MHLLRIIHIEISIQNISLVLSCESHPKCKLKATDNCIKITLRKVNNPCTRKYKHHCFIPGGNNTSPTLMFVTQARYQGAEPIIKHNAPSWSCNKSFGQSKIRQRRKCKNLLKNSNIKEKNQIYYSSQSEHSLIIHQIPANSTQQQRKLQRCLDHVRQLTRSRKWKHKEGRRTSHSYWSWTNGPRGDYSWHIWEASMAMEGLPEVVPPSGRVPGQLLLAARILKWWRRRYREENGNKRSILGVSSARVKYKVKAQKNTWHGSS